MREVALVELQGFRSAHQGGLPPHEDAYFAFWAIPGTDIGFPRPFAAPEPARPGAAIVFEGLAG